MEALIRQVDELQRRHDLLASAEPGAWQLIESVQLAACSLSVTLPSSGSVSQNYRSLVIMGQARGTRNAGTGDSVVLKFNGDAVSNTNYDYITANMTQSSAWVSTEGVGTSGMILVNITSPVTAASTFTPFMITLPNYSLSGMHKLAFSENFTMVASVSGSIRIQISGGRWRNTAPVGTLTFFSPNACNFVAQSEFDLYGIL